FSVRGYLTKIIQERGLELNRDSMVMVANELRANHSPSYIAEQLYEEAKKAGKDAVIESIRTVGEVMALRQKPNFWLFAVDANPELRYNRIIKRNSETDQISFDTFLENEAREMNSDDPNKQNLAACQQLADYNFDNNNSFNELYSQIEKAVYDISK
ncbi:MAG TPA: hypothetical protein PKU83_08975, partial [Chryseolinea sp.]|nr:hypothetical protein [Chryseolinea sp.]